MSAAEIMNPFFFFSILENFQIQKRFRSLWSGLILFQQSECQLLQKIEPVSRCVSNCRFTWIAIEVLLNDFLKYSPSFDRRSGPQFSGNARHTMMIQSVATACNSDWICRIRV